MLKNSFPGQIILSVVIGLFIGVGFLLFSYSFQNKTILHALLFVTIGSFISYLLINGKAWTSFKQLTNMKRSLSFTFIGLLSLILTLALKGPQHHLKGFPPFTVIFIYIAAFVFFFFTVLCIINLLIMQSTKVDKKLIFKRHIIFYASFPFIISLLYFWAFYPGILIIDSVNQWQQAHSTFYNDWHPVMMTWLIKLLTLLWDNPASYIILQIILTSLITGYIIYSFEKVRINTWFLAFGLLFLSLFPIIGLYSVTIWKDTLFSYFFLLFTTMLIQIIYSKGKWLKSYIHLIGLYLSLCGLVFFRHNGWPVLLATIIIFLFFLRKKYWPLYGVFFLVIVTYLCVTGPIYHHFKVFPAESTESYAIPLQQVGRVIYEGGSLTEEQNQFFNRLFPINEWKQKYKRTEIDPVKFSVHFDKEFLKDNKKEFFSNWLAVCINNPKLVLSALYDEVQLAWKLYVPQEDMRPIFRYKSFTTYRPVYFLTIENIRKYHPDYVQFNYYEYGSQNANSKISGVINNIDKIFTHGLLRVTVMPAFYLYLTILFLYVLILKGHWKYLLSAVPFFLNLGSMFVAMPAQDPRYFFVNYLLVIPFFFLATLTIRKRDKNV
jgi:hypothetical protein